MTIPKHYYIDASMLRDWGVCREYFRRRWLDNIVSIQPAIHREFGIAVHLAVEAFWKGQSSEIAYGWAHINMERVDEGLMDSGTKKKWEALKDALPLCLTAYYNHHVQDPDKVEALELEWQLPFTDRVTLVGRIDRAMTDSTLHDTKTASEIGGRMWKSNFIEQSLRDPGLALYDWWWRQVGPAAKGLFLDVIIKPYGNKGSRIELVDMKTLMAHRDRFDSELKFTVNEMVHYMDNYAKMRPWPMNPGTQCVNKYGRCDYLKLCNWGDTTQNLALYVPRVEHLEVRK